MSPSRKLLALLTIGLFYAQTTSASALCTMIAQPENLGALFADRPAFENCAETVIAQQTCHWSFDLGANVSRDTFEVLRKKLTACPTLINATQDAGVNHPDFYDAWGFDFPERQVTISLKDKSALTATFVTLRIRPH